MQTQVTETNRYAKVVAASKRVHWDLEDVFKDRKFDFAQRFLPSSLSKVDELTFLTEDEKRLLTQIQGRSYANIFGLVERFINAKMLEISQEHWFGDQSALEALVRFSEDEIKHQELFRKVERMIGEEMPAGYHFLPDPNDVAHAVLGKSTWAVLALTCHIELFVSSHYRQSIDPEHNVSPLFKDVFLYHWRDEAQHVILDDLEWNRVHSTMSASEVDKAVDELIQLVGAVDGILQVQSAADAEYFSKISGSALDEEHVAKLKGGMLAAYRWQYIISGVQLPRFQEMLGAKITPAQFNRISAALAPIMNA